MCEMFVYLMYFETGHPMLHLMGVIIWRKAQDNHVSHRIW